MVVYEQFCEVVLGMRNTTLIWKELGLLQDIDRETKLIHAIIKHFAVKNAKQGV